MKLYCLIVMDDRTALSVVSDMLPFDLLSWARAHYGHSTIITTYFDISQKEYQRWSVDGNVIASKPRQ